MTERTRRGPLAVIVAIILLAISILLAGALHPGNGPGIATAHAAKWGKDGPDPDRCRDILGYGRINMKPDVVRCRSRVVAKEACQQLQAGTATFGLGARPTVILGFKCHKAGITAAGCYVGAPTMPFMGRCPAFFDGRDLQQLPDRDEVFAEFEVTVGVTAGMPPVLWERLEEPIEWDFGPNYPAYMAAVAHKPRRTGSINVAQEAVDNRIQACAGGIGQGPKLGGPAFIGGSRKHHYRRLRVRQYDTRLRVYTFVVKVHHDGNGYPVADRPRLESVVGNDIAGRAEACR